MITVHAEAERGRVKLDMRFRSLDAAKAAFKMAGLSDQATIVDDEGRVFHGVDTRRGCWPSTKREELVTFPLRIATNDYV